MLVSGRSRSRRHRTVYCRVHRQHQHLLFKVDLFVSALRRQGILSGLTRRPPCQGKEIKLCYQSRTSALRCCRIARREPRPDFGGASGKPQSHYQPSRVPRRSLPRRVEILVGLPTFSVHHPCLALLTDRDLRSWLAGFRKPL